MIWKRYYKKIKLIDNNKEINKNIMIKIDIIKKKEIERNKEGQDQGQKIERININIKINMIGIEIDQ